MTPPEASFTGSIPAIYDTHLGPMFFEPYAIDLARHVRVGSNASILEIAAGTGIVTKPLYETLPSDARLVVTDLNDAMLDIARRKIAPDTRLEWRTADAGALPFADGEFDAALCQFGWMFFPDKLAALRETHRILKRSGTLLFNVWGSLGDNPIAEAAHQVVASFFPTDPPQFFTVPFGFHDQALITGMVTDAGFSEVACETVEIIGRCDSPEMAAKGLIFGTPMLIAIEERATIAPTVIMQAVAARLAREGGASPMRLPMRALVFTATR